MAQCSAERMAAVIKLIVSDFDGTVLPYGQKAVSAAWRSAVSSAIEEGVLFAISSGRTYGELLSFLPELQDAAYFICCDGAYTVFRGRILYARQIPFPELERLLKQEHSFVGCVLHGAFANYAVGRVPEAVLSHFAAKPITNLHLIREPIFKVTSFGGAEAPALPVGIRMHWDGGREAMAQYVSRFANKGTALSDLQMRLPVTRLQTACVGDSGNDVAMMHNAVISICVGDRSDELASVCNVSLRSAEESLELIRRVNEALRAE